MRALNRLDCFKGNLRWGRLATRDLERHCEFEWIKFFFFTWPVVCNTRSRGWKSQPSITFDSIYPFSGALWAWHVAFARRTYANVLVYRSYWMNRWRAQHEWETLGTADAYVLVCTYARARIETIRYYRAEETVGKRGVYTAAANRWSAGAQTQQTYTRMRIARGIGEYLAAVTAWMGCVPEDIYT